MEIIDLFCKTWVKYPGETGREYLQERGNCATIAKKYKEIGYGDAEALL